MSKQELVFKTSPAQSRNHCSGCYNDYDYYDNFNLFDYDYDYYNNYNYFFNDNSRFDDFGVSTS